MSPPMWLPLVSMLVIRSLDTTDPFIQDSMVTAFIVAHVLILLAVGKIYLGIKAAGDKTPLTAPIPLQMGETDQKYEQTYVEAYDHAQLMELLLKKILMIVVILGFVYWKWGAIVPLGIQALMNPYQLYQHQLFKIFIMGQSATGDLKRPWPVPDQTPAFLKSWQQAAQAPEEQQGGKKKKQ